MSRRVRQNAVAVAVALVGVIVLALALPAERPADADVRFMASPGPLAAPHAKLDRDCDACHVPFKGIPNDKCLACHESTARKIASGVGTHASFGARKCVECHKDHRGRSHPLSPPVEAQGFDHAVTGFVLDGAHRSAKCEACHTGGKWVGIATTCVGCHGDTHHKGALGSACQACHSTAGWKIVRHDRDQHRLDINHGTHATLACASCHAKGFHLTSSFQCSDCHEQAHGGTTAPCDKCHHVDGWEHASFQHDFCTCILPGKHQSAPCLGCHPGFKFKPTPLVCSGCHEKDRKHEELGNCARCHSALSWKTKVFDHDRQVPSFPITGKHNTVGCENCHKKKGATYSFKGAPTACAGCHKPPTWHGDFGACDKCHSTAGWGESSFDHARTRFPLDGPHAKPKCADCHGKFATEKYQPGPDACVLCHQDPHRGQFGEKEHAFRQTRTPWLVASAGEPPLPSSYAQGARRPAGAGLPSGHPPGSACLDCHTKTAWKPSTIDVPRHAGFGFALTGAHAAVGCDRCHAGGRFVGTPTECAQCHFDFHGGRFGQRCAQCHVTETWKKTPGFDHGAATGFVLDGAHVRVTCVGCHGEADRFVDQKGPVACALCHRPDDTPHGTQFDADCARCHTTASFTSTKPFDHRKTLFPLERRHAALPCLSCHAASQQRPQIECLGCHQDPHRGAAGSECHDCHRPDRWLLIRFDHDRTEWPLRGAHFSVACADCHRNQQFTGLRTDCVVCHAKDRPANDPNHPKRWDCSSMGCHVVFGWNVH